MLSQLLTAAMVLNGVALFALQVWAWRRNKHHSFGLLAVSTLFAFGSAGLLAALSRFTTNPELYHSIYVAAAFAYFCYMGLGLWGVASLFRSYEQLSRRA